MNFFNDDKTYEESVAGAKTAEEKCNNNSDRTVIDDISEKLDKNILAIALANFLHRELIEDIHAKYNVSQEDMCSMNRQMVNRARCFLEFIEDKDSLFAFQFLYSLATYREWDDPVITDEIVDIMKHVDVCKESIRTVEQNKSKSQN